MSKYEHDPDISWKTRLLSAKTSWWNNGKICLPHLSITGISIDRYFL